MITPTTVAAVLGIWTAVGILVGILVGRHLRHLGEPMHERPAAWPETYPEMRTILDTVITANRSARRPVVDVAGLVRVRRDLGQLDCGTYQACTRSPGGWSSFAAFRLVREVIAVIPLGHPDTAAILRLAADLAEQNNAARVALLAATTKD